ncbi:MAG TPA: endonuclease, partial [Saprospiraceae bacterium]|nr:endonuclease [Saprospiraceae bacterium]
MIFWIWIIVLHHGYGQLFPGLEGQELIDSIRAHYTPSVLLNETQVKDTLYAKVFYQAGTVHCIYSDYAHDLPAGVDPSQYLYGNGSEPSSMNLEHAWPQAKGAEQGLPGNRNMHHLFPSRSAINSTRGDNPYQEIDDAVTQRWYYLDMEQSLKPVTNIDAYSEYKSGAFEPREASKGDIARAMLYFWTIYHEDAVQADPLFFDEMKADLC